MFFNLLLSYLRSDRYLYSHSEKHPIFSVIAERLNKYWSDRELKNRMWPSIQNCILYVYIMLWYDQNSRTYLEQNLWDCQNVGQANKLWVQCGSVFW